MTLFFYLDIRNDHFIEITGYLFRLVFLSASFSNGFDLQERSTERKKTIQTENPFSASQNKVFPPQKWVSTNFSDHFHLLKESLDKIKRFPQDTKCVAIIGIGKIYLKMRIH